MEVENPPNHTTGGVIASCDTKLFLTFFKLGLTHILLLPTRSHRHTNASTFTQAAFSRMLPPWKPGPAQGFFLSKVFSCLCACLDIQALGLCLCKAPGDIFFYCKRHYIKETELNCIELNSKIHW